MVARALTRTIIMSLISVPGIRTEAFSSSAETDRAAQEAFAVSRRVGYVPRPLYHEQLHRHLLSDGSPLVIHAPSGAGKSALLANWVAEFRSAHPTPFIIEHYIGSGGGRDHIGLMRRVAAEIKEGFGVAEELPETPELLTRNFSGWLWYAHRKSQDSAEPTLLLILDALNQLPEEGRDLSWLPERMPPGVRLVVSTTDDDMRDELMSRDWHVMTVEPLTPGERRKVVGQFIRERHLTTERNVIGKLAEDQTSGNPLLLRIRLEEVGRWSQGGTADRDITDFLNAESLDEMYAHMLARAEADHGEEGIRELFSFLALAQNELQIAELHALCRQTEGLAGLIDRMSFHFTNYNGSLRFHHVSLRNASIDRYLRSPERMTATREQLARFFTSLPPSRRTSSEAAHHLHELAHWEDLATFLTELPVQRVLWNDESRYDYMIHWRAAEQHLDIAGICVRQTGASTTGIRTEEESARTLMRAGSILQITGHTPEALQFFTDALSHAGGTDNPELIAEAYKHCGTVNWRLGDAEKAREYFIEGMAAAQKAENRLLWATIMGNLGNLELTRGNFREAMRLQQINLKEARKKNDPQEIIRIYGNLGSTCLMMEEYAEAEKHFKAMLELLQRENDARRMAIALGSMGILHYRQGNYEAALEKYREQEKIADHLGDKEQRALVIGNRGNIHFDKKEYDEALGHYRQMEEMGEALRNPRIIAMACNGIGQTWLEKGFPDKAVPYFCRAKEQHRKLGNVRGDLKISIGLGAIEFKRKNYARALDFFEESRRLARQIDARSQLTEAMEGEGQTLLRLGQLEEAEARFREELETGREMNGIVDQLRGLSGLGSIRRKQGNPAEALRLFDEGIGLAEDAGLEAECEGLLRNAFLTSIENIFHRNDHDPETAEWSTRLDRLRNFCVEQDSVSAGTRATAMLFDLWRRETPPSLQQIGTLLSSIDDEEERADTARTLLLLATSCNSPLISGIRDMTGQILQSSEQATPHSD